jgi:hypothetical protein
VIRLASPQAGETKDKQNQIPTELQTTISQTKLLFYRQETMYCGADMLHSSRRPLIGCTTYTSHHDSYQT